MIVNILENDIPIFKTRKSFKINLQLKVVSKGQNYTKKFLQTGTSLLFIFT